MVFSFFQFPEAMPPVSLSGIERSAQAQHDVVFFFQGFFCRSAAILSAYGDTLHFLPASCITTASAAAGMVTLRCFRFSSTITSTML
jgi:hypothetical protein